MSPDKALILALGLIVGLALGVSAAVFWAALDSTVGGRDEAAELTYAPVLGALPTDRKAGGGAVVASADYFAPLAEAFRSCKQIFAFWSPSAWSLVVTSAADGEARPPSR